MVAVQNFAEVTELKQTTGRATCNRAPLTKSFAVLKPKVRVPVEVVQGTVSPAIGRAAVDTLQVASRSVILEQSVRRDATIT